MSQTSFFKDTVANQYAQLVYDGLWYTPLKKALDAFVDSTQETVTGTVKLKLYKEAVPFAAANRPIPLQPRVCHLRRRRSI